MNDKIDIIVAGVNRKDKKMWGDFYDRFYTVLFLYGRGSVPFLILKNLPIIFIVPAIIIPYYIYVIIKFMILF